MSQNFRVFVILLFIFAGASFSQSITTLWSYSFGEFSYDAPDRYAQMVDINNNGDFLLSGSYLILMDSTGNVKYEEKKYQSLALASFDSGYFITFRDSGNVYAAKLNANFDVFWTINLSESISANSVTSLIRAQPAAFLFENQNQITCTDHDYLLYGSTIDNNVWWCHITDHGNMVWSVVHETQTKDIIENATTTLDGGYILSGQIDNKPVILKISYDGLLEWQRFEEIKSQDYTYNLTAKAVVQNADGTFGFCYNDIDPATQKGFVTLCVTDIDGFVTKRQTFFESDLNWLTVNHMVKTPDGGYILTGYRSLALYPNQSAMVLRTDANGKELWREYFKGDGNSSNGRYIINCNENSYCFCGADADEYDIDNGTKSMITMIKEDISCNANFEATPVSGTIPLTVQFTDLSSGLIDNYNWSFGDFGTSTEQNPQIVFNKVDSISVTLIISGPGGSGSLTRENYIKTSFPTEIAEEPKFLNTFCLYQNYPNPFNPATNIQYDVSMTTHIDISIYSINGELVETLVNGIQARGNYFYKLGC